MFFYGFLWFFQGFSIVFPVFFYGFSMVFYVFLWVFHDFSMVFPRVDVKKCRDVPNLGRQLPEAVFTSFKRKNMSFLKMEI
jgi:hypothetical protein